MSSTVGVKLADLCHLVSVQVNPQATPVLPYIGLEHVPPGRFCTLATGVASDALSAKFLFQAGDILYNKLRPYLDKAVLTDGAGVCTTELLVLRPKAGIDSRYIACVVHSPAFIDHAMSGVTGAHHPRTSWHHISQFTFSAHSKDERHGIADLMFQVHALLLISETACRTAMQIKQAAMASLFTRGLRGEAQKETEIGRVPESWSVSALGRIASLERGRFTHRPRNEPRFYGGNTPFVQTGDVVRSQGLIRTFSQSLNENGVAISRVFPAGTILITIAANIGYCGVLTFDCACPDSLVAISPRAGIDNAFLKYWLQTQQPSMDRQASKGIQKNINIQFLKPWPVVVPELEEQVEIAKVLGTIDRKIALHQQKRAVLEDLFKALLHKLMTGEIDVNALDLQALSAHEPAIEASPA